MTVLSYEAGLSAGKVISFEAKQDFTQTPNGSVCTENCGKQKIYIINAYFCITNRYCTSRKATVTGQKYLIKFPKSIYLHAFEFLVITVVNPVC